LDVPERPRRQLCGEIVLRSFKSLSRRADAIGFLVPSNLLLRTSLRIGCGVQPSLNLAKRLLEFVELLVQPDDLALE